MFRQRLHTLCISLLLAGMPLVGCDIGPITPPDINQAPTANAGVDLQRCVGQEVMLDGLSSSDADGDSLFYNWSSVRCAASCDLDSANIPTPRFVPSMAGLYEFSLTVTDDRGGSDLDTTRVVVVNCHGSNPCEGVECPPEQVCNLDTGECEPICEADEDCVDDDPCTNDTCTASACYHVLIECDDGLFCNGFESCEEGNCVSSGSPCAPGQTCDDLDDLCLGEACASHADCDDGDSCTADECVDGECVFAGVDVPFTEWVISTTADGARSVFATDLDGDGDTDVLSASALDDKIAWYESDGGSPPDFTEHVISTTADGARSVYATDVDGDGDTDVLSASLFDDKIAWYESDGGSPPSFSERVVSISANGGSSVFATDLDGDGDTDVLSASGNDGRITWYESDSGSPPTFTERVISSIDQSHGSVFATDVDGDGDTDILSASQYDSRIAWYESDGGSPPIFTERTISTTADFAQAVFATDLDGDGDTDVLSASGNDDKIAWYENDGGSPPAFEEQVISTTAGSALSVFALDFDGDGDTDVLSASELDNKIAWYESDGGSPPTFTERVISTAASLAQSVFAADLDGDGDSDVLSASLVDDKIAWHENLLSCGPTMAFIPGADFEMGCHAETGESCQSNEVPVHGVYVGPFYMAVYEVTNHQYCAYLNSAHSHGLIEVTNGVVYKADSRQPYCDTRNSSSDSRITWNGSTFGILEGKENHPMVMVSWYGAAAYANWRSEQRGRTPAYDESTWECNFNADGYRLPTEAEWEYASRGGPCTPDPYYTYPWCSNEIDGAWANYVESGDPYEQGLSPETTPVGFYNGELHVKVDFDWPGMQQTYETADGSRAFGLYDMVGNASEWCNDWYSEDYYTWGPYENPQGPVSGEHRVSRSGSWTHHTDGGVRCADRNQRPPDDRSNNHGFRLAAGR